MAYPEDYPDNLRKAKQNGHLYRSMNVPIMPEGGNIEAETAAVGTDWVAFADQACAQLTIVNNTGTTIEFRQGGAGVGLPVFDQSAFTIFGILNANEIEIRRVDVSGTQVTCAARWEG